MAASSIRSTRASAPAWPGFRDIRSSGPNTLTEYFQALRVFLTWCVANDDNSRELIGYVIGHVLRERYGLAKGRRTYPTGTLDQRGSGMSLKFGNSAGTRDYEEIEALMDLEAIRLAAPPAQRDAIDIFLEAEQAGVPVAEICHERGRDPNLVRNNLQALKRAVKKRHGQSW